MADLKEVPEVKAVAEGNTSFSTDLYHTLKKVNTGNLIYSPFSVSAVVAMAKTGARGTTADEISKGMRYPVDDATLGRGYSKILASFQESNENFTLAAANRLYSQTGFSLNSDFAKGVKENFLAEVEQLNFAESTKAAATINNWVEKITHEKIKDLIPADALTALTRLVLVNGIYFKGLWKNKFNPEHTQKDSFFINETDSVEVDMMFKEEKFPYGVFESLGAHAVALPYKGDRLSMIIFVPRERTGLSKIEAGLKDLTPQSIFNEMGEGEKIQVYLPRFKLESTHALVQSMKELGMKTMFDSSCADFSGIPEDGTPLFVSDVIQKAFIEVNEEGSEAAAATGMIMMMRCMPIVIPFRADRPFLFQIVDRHTNFVLFAGRCINPKA